MIHVVVVSKLIKFTFQLFSRDKMTENVRGSDHEMPLRQSLFQSLKEEVVVEDELDAHLLELKRERVSNFLSLPFAMERVRLFRHGY